MAIARGELVGELLDGQTQIFREAASLHLLNREATRYQEFFSVCLLRPDGPAPSAGLGGARAGQATRRGGNQVTASGEPLG
jgi:hypothetical protein